MFAYHLVNSSHYFVVSKFGFGLSFELGSLTFTEIIAVILHGNHRL